MMKTKILISCLFIVAFTASIFAQEGSISGIVFDKQSKQKVPYATVALLKQNSEKALTGSVSDEFGNFKIEKISSGTYKLVISFIGYNSEVVKNVKVTSKNANINLGDVFLSPSETKLNTLKVTGTARTATTKIDRKSYRASDFAAAQGGNALTVLSKIPSVTVDSEENISVRGTTDFMVYLNGKPVNTDASMILGQIPSDNIADIDIITVPGSRYDAQGKGGIINITTKRNTRQGLSVFATGMLGGTPWSDLEDQFSSQAVNNNRYNGGLNISYNKGALALHAAMNYSEKNNRGIGDIFAYIYQNESMNQPGDYYVLEGIGNRPKWDKRFYSNLGADYKLSEKQDISVNYQYSKRNTGRTAHYKYNTYFTNEVPARGLNNNPVQGTSFEIYNPNDINRDGEFHNLSVDYKLKVNDKSTLAASFTFEQSDLDQAIDNKGFKYTGDKSYYDYNSDGHGAPFFHSLQSDGTPLNAYRGALGYVTEFEDGSKLDVGYNAQLVRLDGSFSYDIVSNQNTLTNAEYDFFNNAINLSRDVHAAYIDYSRKSDKLSYIVGLRAEYMDQQLDVDSTKYFEQVYKAFDEVGRDFNEKQFAQNKLDLFPSLHIKYQFNETNSMVLAASRRINRPPAKDLVPFLYRRHQEVFEMGDPLLKPEYSWNADLSYTLLFGKHNMTATGFVRTVNNAISRVNSMDYDLDNAGGVLLRSYTNAGNQTAMGGELSFNFDIASKIKAFVGGSLYEFAVESDENLFGDQVDNSSLNWDAKTTVTWFINKPLKLSADYLYKSASVTPQGEKLKFEMMNIVLNYVPQNFKNWNFYAKMVDVLETNQTGGFTRAIDGNQTLMLRDYVYDYSGQIVELGASYTFNQKKRSTQKIIGDEFY